MKFNITQQLIDGGVRCSPYFCPAAECLTETLDLEDVCVSPSNIWITRDGKTIKIRTPTDLGKRIREYDATGFMEPNNFELEIPNDFLPQSPEGPGTGPEHSAHEESAVPAHAG